MEVDMKSFLKAAFVAAALGGAALAAAPAHAGHSSSSAGIYIGPDSFGIYVSSGHRDYWRDDRRRYDRRHHGKYKRWDGAYLYGHWYAEPRYFRWDVRHRRYVHHGRGCHPVFKIGFEHGRRVKIGAVMCYDHRGRSYIKAKSRYVIAYY